MKHDGPGKDDTAELCAKCGKPLGSNPDCEPCLHHLIMVGTEGLTREEVEESVEREKKWHKGRGKSAPDRLVDNVRLLAVMVQDYVRGNYKKMPWSVITMGAFAILYAVNPFDLLPDFIPGLGFVDDVAVLSLILKAIQGELSDYESWKDTPQEPAE